MAKVEIIAANLKNKVSSSVKRILKRVCAYCRVSTDSEEQETSYNSQIEYYSKLIKKNPDWTFVDVYADKGKTGTQVKHRQEFQRMIDDALNGKIDMIIAKSISRFARNTLDTLNYVRLLRDHNVDVFFEKENIHTLEMDSEMFLTFYSAFAQAESESTSTNVRMGLKAKMSRGEPIGSCSCYGLRWNKVKKKFIIIEEEAKVVRRIFKMYIEGIGTGRIAQILTKEKVKTYTGKTYWQQATIVRIIRNEKYVGDLLGQKSYIENPLTHKSVMNYGEKPKYYVKNHHKGIIDRETWDKAQEIYNRRSKKCKPDGHTHCDKYSIRYAFSSKIFCGFCGTNFVRRSCKKKTGEGKHVYWACSHKVMEGSSSCSCKSIRDDFLQDLFIAMYNNICKEYSTNNEKLLKTIKEVTNTYNYDNEIAQIKSEEEKVLKKKSNLLEMKLENYIDKDTFIAKDEEFKIKLDELHNKLIEIENQKNKNKNLSNRMLKIEKVLNENVELKEFDRDLFNTLVDCIIVGEIDDKGNKNPNVIRLILNTGKEIRQELDFYKSLNENLNANSILINDSKCNHLLSNDNKEDTLLSLDNRERLYVCDLTNILDNNSK